MAAEFLFCHLIVLESFFLGSWDLMRGDALPRYLAITLYFKAVCFHVIWKHTATGSKTDTKLEYTHYQWDSSCIVVWTQV